LVRALEEAVGEHHDDGTPYTGLSGEDIDDLVESGGTDAYVRAIEIIVEAKKLYEELTSLLGPSSARVDWISLTRSPQGGAPRGSRDPRQDAWLLHLYDKAARNDPDAVKSGALPRLFAERLMAGRPPHVAASVPALEKRIRMLLKARKKSQGL
jgi:hypothetical protein